MIIILLGIANISYTASIYGFIIDSDNGERVGYASVGIADTNIGTITNQEGYYVIKNAPAGKIKIFISHISYKPKLLEIKLLKKEQKFLQVELEENILEIEGATTIESKYEMKINAKEISVSAIRQSTQDILDIPQVADPDVFRALTMMPGVSSLSDFSSGMYIRGGSPDQNLILIDNTDVYNPNHFGGIFSTFNTDAIENVELIKSGFPAKYGGRLSSVLNITNLDGNRKYHEGVMRTSFISSSATLQGPWKVGQQKGSYMASFRRTYFELYRQFIPEIPNYYFYDGHTKLTWDATDRDKFTVSSYFGKDKLDINMGSRMIIQWGNETVTAQWMHVYNPDFFSTTILAGSHFGSKFIFELEDDKKFSRLNDINDLTLREMFIYTPNDNHSIDFGIDAKYNNIEFVMKADSLEIAENSLPDVKTKSYLTSGYIQDNWSLGAFWTIQPGIRVSYFSSSCTTLKNAPDANYFKISPRLALRRKLTLNSNIFVSYGRYYQFLTSLNPGASTPMDLWFPLDGNVKAGISDHFTAGFKGIINPSLSLDFELYYKLYDNLVEYRPEIDYEWNNETCSLRDIYNVGNGYSYGIDVLLRNNLDGIKGSIGYSFGITEKKIESTNTDPYTNNEQYYHPNYERVHQVNIIETFNLSDFTGWRIWSSDINLSSSYTYGSGQPTSDPELMFPTENGPVFLYGYKDSSRLPAYSRCDLSLKFKHHFKTWSIEPYLQVINVFNHFNVWNRAFSYEKNEETGEYSMKKENTGMFPRIPFIGFNIEW